MLANPGGTGLALAKEFEAQADKYAKIGIVVGTQIEQARKDLKNIQILQDTYLASEQGFYYSVEPEPEQPVIDPSTAIIVNLDEEKKKE